MGQEDDNHIFRFVKSKFGYVDETDFETRLYLCLPIFQTIGWDYFTVSPFSSLIDPKVQYIIINFSHGR